MLFVRDIASVHVSRSVLKSGQKYAPLIKIHIFYYLGYFLVTIQKMLTRLPFFILQIKLL